MTLLKSRTSRLCWPTRTLALGVGLLTACQLAYAQRGFVDFTRVSLDEDMRGGYGVEVGDVDGDGLQDIIALSTNPAQFVWYRNPGWEKYRFTSQAERNIDAAPLDIDGDGDLDIVLASEFALGESTEGGSVHWFENPGNPTQNQEWARHFIDAIPTSHRIKWSDVNGDGQPELINLPIIGFGATAPDYSVNLLLTAYAIPEDLTVAGWPSVVLDESLQLAHGLALTDWDDDGQVDILTASFDGVHLFRLARNGQAVFKQHIGLGKQGAERPAIGASEVDVGNLGDSTRFFATVEPWHGNEVVVYTSPDDNSGELSNEETALWNRTVIDEQFANGHGLLVADLNNDGSDEVIVGGRSEPYQLAIFRYLEPRQQWRRLDLDLGGVAVSGLAVEDFNGDGFLDIVAIGAGTQNVVYYENSGL